MSRSTISIDVETHIHVGTDHAIGKFIDVTDERFAGTSHDPQGEGYLMEWSELFGFTTNLIGITIEELKLPNYREIIKNSANFYLKKLKLIS